MTDEQFYKRSISEMVSTIRNVDWLRSIYSFIKAFAEDKEETNNGRKKNEKETFATEIINEAVKQRNRWRLAAVISIILNLIQWIH